VNIARSLSVLSLFFLLFFYFQKDALAESVTLRSGSVVVVQTTRAYSSESARPDELVDLIVASDVLVNGKVAIRQGTPVSASIEDLESTQMMGREGKISISINSTRAVDGTTVPLSGRLSSRGADEMTGTVVGAFFCPLFLLNKGGEATIASGAQGRGIVLGDVIINVN
jgi:hypothetical protein